MCGIVGALVFNDSSYRITEKYLTSMRDAMVHRGPDGFGHWVSADCKVGFGHRRLSIVDLSSNASQPMCDASERIWLTFNGEIYNHQEVREELVRLGYTDWKTDHSDTEVIIKAYQEWGVECLSRFRGMFAFALWDDRHKTLWLVRDRVGVKPLYYSIHHGRIVFASEIKALLQDPDQQREVNEEAFFHYLSFLTTPAPQTLFDGVKKVPAGTYLLIKPNGHCEEVRYWDVFANNAFANETFAEEELPERLLAELKTAVGYRGVSDVPVGVLLSGGIDSSTNAALFQQERSSPIKTFSIGYQGEYDSYSNETVYAKRVADQIGAEYHERLLCMGDLLDFVPEMVYYQDEPIADPVCVPVHFVSDLVRQNDVIVAQVGEGADELFCGYPSWKRRLNRQNCYSKIPSLLLKAGAELLGGVRRDLKETSTFEQLMRAGNGKPIFWGGAEAFTESHKRRLLSARLKKQFKRYSSWEAIKPIRQRFNQTATDKTPLNWMAYLDLNFRLPELLLMRVDKMSMISSIEARVPFLDHKFVELAMSIPANQRYKDGNLKHLLKKSVRGLIPDEIIDRKKQGFGVPLHEWYFDRLGSETEKILKNFCSETDFFNYSEVEKLYSKKLQGQLWYLLNFALWHKQFISG